MISLFCCWPRYHEPEIIHAVNHEKWVKVLNLLNNGADPNARDWNGTPAIELATKADDAVMKMYVLLSRGAKVIT
ncbi:MAG: hypothetical protein ChlgKO_10750 [Chlamydiales bacterium]